MYDHSINFSSSLLFLSEPSIRDNSRGTQFELPALCNAKWRRCESFCCIIAGAALWDKQNKSPSKKKRAAGAAGGDEREREREGWQTNFASTAHNEAKQQTNPSPSVDKKSGFRIRAGPGLGKVSVAKCEKNKTRRASQFTWHLHFRSAGCHPKVVFLPSFL